MGSLPNLHELGRPEGEEQGFKPGPALGHLCGGCNGMPPATTEKSKMLFRFSGHNKITKAQSNPTDSNKIVYDDVMLEHMATYSPISSRSRCNLHSQGGFKRRDSINSSIGATSVRRLLAVVRGTGGGQQSRGGTPVLTRRALIANLVLVCVSHLLTSAAYLPFLALQASVSAWYRPVDLSSTDVTAGSLLVTGTYAVAAICSLMAPFFLKRVSPSIVVTLCHGVMMIFYLSHLHPVKYVVIPASIILGVVQGLLCSAHVSFLMVLSHRIGLFHEEEVESRQARRTCIIRRVARAFQASNDFGLIVGSVLSAIIINFTMSTSLIDRISVDNITSTIADECPWNTTYSPAYCRNATSTYISSPTSEEYATPLDALFDRTEEGRLCGAQACPVRLATPNLTLEAWSGILAVGTADMLVGVYAGACGAALVFAALGLDRIRMLVYQDPLEKGELLAVLKSISDSFKDRRLQWAAPLAVFIGVEQAFMYADFSQSYVVCTLGIHRLNLVFLAMGLLQSIAACTLSMLLRTIRRYYVVAVGFVFHGCLIMVLVLWKPTEDDPALFYVISASWGVCNSIWEMLNFTFLTGQYAENWEAAFANAFFFRFLGFSLAFCLHGLLCNALKLYAMAFELLVAAVAFGWLEIKLENVRKMRNITRL